MIFSTWNVHGAFSCLSQISDVVEFSDIVFISEHWLPDICQPSLSTTFGNHISYIANPGITTNNITITLQGEALPLSSNIRNSTLLSRQNQITKG